MGKGNKRITTRGIQIALGLLWLLDGALQLQHQMFTSSFAHQVIAPAAQGQPLIVRGPIHFGIHIILLHPALFDAFFALIQLAIGACILYRPLIKYGLIGSVIWGLSVWFAGEGLAGMASGHATLLMGAPGAALLYAIIALAVFPRGDTKKKQDTEPAYWLAIIWALLWIGGAVFQLLPGQNSVSDLSAMIIGNINGAPGWLATIDAHAANFVNSFGTTTTSMTGLHMTTLQMAQMSTEPSSGYGLILLLALLQSLIGLAIFIPHYLRKIAIAVGIILSILFWVIGQSLGGYYTGLATDPNTAPLVILLGVAILGCTQLDKKLSGLFKRIEDALV
jgi:uncharacterized membrane protein YwaF